MNGVASRKAIEKWFGSLRGVCAVSLIRNAVRLGVGIVEVDECCLGRKRKYNRGFHRGQQSWVVGMVDRETKRCHVEVVRNRTGSTLLPIIRQHVVPGTRIHSDEAPVYNALTGMGYTHSTVCHKRNYVAPDGTHTNNIENLWSHLKTQLKGSRGIQKHKLPHHVAEFVFRWNNKRVDDIFSLLLDEIALQYPV